MTSMEYALSLATWLTLVVPLPLIMVLALVSYLAGRRRSQR